MKWSNINQIQEVTDDIALNLEDTDQTVTELNRTAKHLQTNLTQNCGCDLCQIW